MRFIAGLVVILLFSQASNACENRLVGTWRSDGPQTMSFNRQNVKLEKRQDAFLDTLMGKMTPEFNDKDLHLRMPNVQVPTNGVLKPFDGFEERTPYAVLFCNHRMTVVKVREAVTDEDVATTYFFVGPDIIWTYTGTNSPKGPDLHLREYFNRVE